MISRREVLAGGGSGLAALGFAWPAFPSHAATPGRHGAHPRLFLHDTAIAGSGHAATLLRGEGVPSAAFSGDVGGPWAELVEPLWRSGPQAIAGITYPGALFCMEHLARTYGLACTLRSPVESGAAACRSILRAAGLAAAPAKVAERGDDAVVWLLQPRRP